MMIITTTNNNNNNNKTPLCFLLFHHIRHVDMNVSTALRENNFGLHILHPLVIIIIIIIINSASSNQANMSFSKIKTFNYYYNNRYSINFIQMVIIIIYNNI